MYTPRTLANKIKKDNKLAAMDLKDCPFCDCDEIHTVKGTKHSMIYCAWCGVEMGAETVRDVTIKWNSRSFELDFEI